MPNLSLAQFGHLVLLTLLWGLNWPIIKVGIASYPPLTFRVLSMWLGLPVLALGMVLLKAPLRMPLRHWREVIVLATTNMLVWHVCIMLALTSLSSGRAAVLGYTMPVFSALIGAWLFSARVGGRGWLGVAAAATGVGLLLWNELSSLAGRPLGVALVLVAAATWALGTQLMRRARLDVPTLTLTFWMLAFSTVVMTVPAIAFEHQEWRMPPATAAWSILFNAVGIFGLSYVIWITLARNLPPVASTLSVMMIPVVGVFSGALWLGEVLLWQDFAAVGLMVLAIGVVLWPSATAPAPEGRAPDRENS